MTHTLFAHDAEAPDPQAADEDEFGSQGKRFHNVAGSAHAGVVHDIDPVADGLHDVLQGVQARDRAVDLPRRVVAHHDPVDAVLDALLGVRDGLDPLDGEGTTARDALPLLDQPGNLLPREEMSVPDAVDPLGRGGDGVFLNVDARLATAFLEDRVRQTQTRADAAVEGVVGMGDVVVSPAQLPGVGGQDEGVESRVPRPVEQRERQLVVVRHVQLEEARAVSIGRGDLFNGRASCG